MIAPTEAAPAAPPRTVWLIMSGVLLALLLASMDGAIVATAMPTIISSLAGFDRYAWVTTAYLLAQSIATPIFGKLSDIFGRKAGFMGGVAIFLVGSAGCGLTPSMDGLILFRGVQGIGGGAIVVIATVVIADLFPPRERGKIQGLTGAIIGVSSVVGPALGGWITDGFGWRWVFFVNLPLGAVTLGVLAWRMPTLRQPDADRSPRSIDWLGAALLTGGTVPLLLALTWAGSTYAWASPQVVGCLVVAAVLAAAFVWHELRVPQPIMDPRLFRSGIVAVCIVVSALVAGGLFGATQYIPLYLQGVAGSSAAGSGAVLTPLMFGAIGGSVVSGLLVSRLGRYRPVALAGQLLSVIGMGILVQLAVGSPVAVVSVAMIVLGVGLGFGLSLYTTVVQAAAPPAMLAQATSALTFFRSLGGTVAVAVMGGVLTWGYTGAFAAHVPPALRDTLPAPLVQELRHNPQAITTPGTREGLRAALAAVPGGDALIAQLTEAIRVSLADALHGVFVACLLVSALALLLTLFLREVPLHSAAPEGATPASPGSLSSESSMPKASPVPRTARGAMDAHREIPS